MLTVLILMIYDDEKSKKDFQPIYHATSYLAPFSRMVLPKEKTNVIKKFLKGVYK